LINVEGRCVKTDDALLETLQPAIATKVVEKGLQDDSVHNAQSLVQNKGLKQFKKERSLIRRNKLGKDVTKK
jgi:hypothetical protein